jgi:hypothetical protein
MKHAGIQIIECSASIIFANIAGIINGIVSAIIIKQVNNKSKEYNI